MCMGGPGMDAVLAHHAQLNAYERTGDPSYLTAAQQIPGAVVTGTSTEETGVSGSRVGRSDTAARFVDVQSATGGLGTTGTASRGTVLGSTS